MNPADFHSERFYCKLRSVAHPCMVMKVGMHEYQGTWRMKLLAPYPAHSAPNRVPSIEVAMYTRDGSRCLIAMRVHSVPMSQLPLLLRAAVHLERKDHRQVRSRECALADRCRHVFKRHGGAERVPVRHDRLHPPFVPAIPAVDLEVAAALQQLAAVGVGRAQASQLVADNVRVVRGRHPV